MISEKRKKRNKTDAANCSQDALKPTEEELDVAKYLYKKLATKDGRLSGTIVRTFNPTEAVDLLLDSPWAKVEHSGKKVAAKNRKPQLFTNQTNVISYLNTLLQKQMLHRAVRVRRKPPTAVSGKSKEDGKSSKSKMTEKSSVEGKNVVDKDEVNEITESTESKKPAVELASKSEEPITPTPTKSSNPKPMRLEVHPEQVFVLDDPLTVYVWIYEPPPGLFIWLAGSALLIGIILCCLFPIWPAHLRTGAYYLTLCASGLFGLLLAVALFRLMFYLTVWLMTFGCYAFWLFPNFFEDCSFFESFRPIYSMKKIGATTSTEKTKKSSSRTNKTSTAKSKSSSSSNKELTSEPSSFVEISQDTNSGADIMMKTDLGKID